MASGVKVNGVWQPIKSIYAKVNGTWQSINTAYGKVNGTWQVVWENIVRFVKSSVSGKESYIVKQPEYIELYCYDSVSGGGASVVTTSKAVDLTGVSYINFDVSYDSNSSIQSDIILQVATTPGGSYVVRTYQGSPFSRQIKQLNVSSLSGKYYIQVWSTSNANIKNWSLVRLYAVSLDSTQIWKASDPNSTSGI